MQKTQERFVAAEGTDALTKLGGNVLTEVSSTHDPLLERQIGRRVVLEVVEADMIHEHVGIFKEYSADFLHLLDVQYPMPQTLEVTPDRGAEQGRLTATLVGDTLRIDNRGDRPVLVVKLDTADGERSVDALVEPEGLITLPIEAPDGKLLLRIQTICDLDIIVPRARGSIRYCAEQANSSTQESKWDTVFDLGITLRSRDAERETALRERLAETPDDPRAAATLGALLLERGECTEAGRWLRTAYNGRDALPDGGRRVRMQLRELARKLKIRDGSGFPRQ